MSRLFKFVVPISVLVGCALLVGCGSDNSTTTTSVPPATTAASVPATTAGGTESSGSNNYLEPANFKSQVDELKKKEGSDAELLQVSASDGAFVVQLRKASNDTAYGYESNAAGQMQPVKVEVSGSGSLKNQAFPISKLDSDTAETIANALKKMEGAKAKLTNISMQRNPASGTLMWTVGYENDTRTGLSLFAPPSGSPLSKSPVH